MSKKNDDDNPHVSPDGRDTQNAEEATVVHPTAFGKYAVIRHLGSGAFAHTFEVKAPTGECYALKWLRESPPPHGKERLTNEAWALSKLSHPSIPDLIDQGSHLGRPFIVMTLARGTTLNNIHQKQLEEEGSMGQQRLLAILEELFDAIIHAHAKGICHRDVKHDNIIVNPSGSQVTLIDFGMCKGSGQPVDAETFWNAGASRFSPPSKISRPTIVHETHDVFSLGVVAYVLLTNSFPWSVGQGANHTDLENLMEEQNPTQVNQLNNFVSQEVSDFIMSLLLIDDDSRPTANSAYDTIRNLRHHSGDRLVPPSLARGAVIRFPRVIRDAVHGDISMTEFEWKVIETQEFQRLRWIRQLGTTKFVYPGAEHSRYTQFLFSDIMKDTYSCFRTISGHNHYFDKRCFSFLVIFVE